MLSTTSEYALRALACLAAQPAGTALLGRDLAKAADVPANYLSKILLTLRNAEVVDTTRGLAGGYRLHRRADEIFLIDIVELFDGVSRTKPTCFLRRQKPCSSAARCNAHDLWRDVQARYVGFLVSTPLSALAAPVEPTVHSIPRAVEGLVVGGHR
jgi:Rrf2 family transcriptional regulator, iron-sulfur cluster assembly transcription factor